MALSAEQQAFVDHGLGGHARLLAGPGTGKSFTSVEFLKALASRDVKPRCHMITFTRAATKELAEKIDDLPNITDRPPSTAHSFAMSLLMRADNPGSLRMADDWEKRWVVQELIRSRMATLGQSVNIRVVKQLTDEMAAGWQALDLSMLELSDQKPDLAAAFVGAWKEVAAAFEFVHISEIPFRAVQILEDNPIDPALDLLVVDEFQDLNYAEVRLLELLSDRVTLIAIGDDDQSIYGWRNAAPDALLNFCDTNAGAPTYELSVCHRCPSEILEPAKLLIASAPGRLHKTPLSTVEGTSGYFAQIIFDHSDEEFRDATAIIQARLEMGVPPSEIAVLVRSSPTTYRNELNTYCEPLGIELLSVDWAKDALEDDSLRRLLALGRLVNEPEDSLAWATLLRVTDGLGGGTISKLYEGACHARQTFQEHLAAERVAGFPSLAPMMRSRVEDAMAGALAAVAELEGEQVGVALDDTGWGGWLLRHQGAQQVGEDAGRLLIEVGAELYAEDGDMSLKGFVTQFSQRALDLAENNLDAIRVMSMSSSKGLTVDTTILLGVDDDTMPSPKAVSEDEERRILYVAMTRATTVSVITFARDRSGPTAYIGGAGPLRKRSRFLQGLPGMPSPIDSQTALSALSGRFASGG